MLSRLTEAINEVCPCVGVAGSQDGIVISYGDTATPQQKVAAQTIVGNFDWSEIAQSAWQLAKFRTKASDALANQDQEHSALIRAVVLELLDYCNAQRHKHNQLLQWIGAQTTLSNRGQLASLQLTEATPQQAKAASVNRIEQGEAD